MSEDDGGLQWWQQAGQHEQDDHYEPDDPENERNYQNDNATTCPPRGH